MSNWTPPSPSDENKNSEAPAAWTPPSAPASSWTPPSVSQKKSVTPIWIGIIGGIFVLFFLIAGVTHLVKSNKNKARTITDNDSPSASSSDQNSYSVAEIAKKDIRELYDKGINGAELHRIRVYGDLVVDTSFSSGTIWAKAKDSSNDKIFYSFSHLKQLEKGDVFTIPKENPAQVTSASLSGSLIMGITKNWNLNGDTADVQNSAANLVRSSSISEGIRAPHPNSSELKSYSPEQIVSMNPDDIDFFYGQLYGEFTIAKLKGNQVKAFATSDKARKVIYLFSWDSGIDTSQFKENYKMTISPNSPSRIGGVASQMGKTTVMAQIKVNPQITVVESVEQEQPVTPTYVYRSGRSSLYQQGDMQRLAGSTPSDSWVHGQFTVTSRSATQITAHPAGGMTGSAAETAVVESIRQGIFGGRRSAPVRKTYRPTRYIFELTDSSRTSIGANDTFTISSSRPAKIKRVSGYGNDITVVAILVYPPQ